MAPGRVPYLRQTFLLAKLFKNAKVGEVGVMLDLEQVCVLYRCHVSGEPSAHDTLLIAAEQLSRPADTHFARLYAIAFNNYVVQESRVSSLFPPDLVWCLRFHSKCNGSERKPYRFN